MKRYAFIDVLNTSNTAQRMLGFVVDWAKLCDYLKNKKSCETVFLYTGIENGDLETAAEFDALSNIGCVVVRSKSVFAYKNKDKTIATKCKHCGAESVATIDMGYTKKSNCDVELGVDAIEKAGPEREFYIFTADGDFEYLIRRALEKGVDRVTIVSHAVKHEKAGMTISRFSTKLRHLIAQNREEVFFMDLKDIKDIIKKDIA